MKLNKVICLLLAVAMLFVFVSCNSKESRVAKFVEENKDTLSGALNSEIGECEIYAEGASIVYELKMDKSIGATADNKDEIEEGLKMGLGNGFFEKAKEKVGGDALESIIFKVCDEDGSLITEVVIDK